MKRAAIYFFYDADGVVDRYVEYMLKELHTVADYLLVVVNGKLTPEGRALFADVADDFFVRKNDMDVPAFKDGIEYITWEKLLEYDELILENATIYGPFKPMKDIFEEMDSVKCDYWGINRVYRNDTITNYMGRPLPWGYKPEDVLTNFHVYRSRLLHSYEFRKHWDTLPEIKSYADSIFYHEMAFAVKMENAGFTFETLDNGMPANAYPSSTVSGAYEMLSKYNIPFVRRKAVFDPNGSNFDYGPLVPRKVLEFIDKHTDYDVGMIWENQLRTNSHFDLMNWVGLTRIVSADIPTNEAESEISYAVILYIKDKGRLCTCAEYLRNFPEGTHLLLMCDDESILNDVKSDSLFAWFDTETALVSGNGREASALTEGSYLLQSSGKYEAICFVTDQNENIEQYTSIDDLFNTLCYKNSIGSSCYIENVLHILANEPYAGVLIPYTPTHAHYFDHVGGSWENQNNINFVGESLKKLNRKVVYANHKPPIVPFGPVFWFRIAALEPLFTPDSVVTADENNHGRFKFLYPLIAQSNGYYSLSISETGNAEMELLHMTFQTQKMRQLFIQEIKTGNINNFSHLVSLVQQSNKRKSIPNAPASPSMTPDAKPKKSGLKRFIKACMPRGLWNLLRRAKCKALGWEYVE